MRRSALLFLLSSLACLHAETGYEAWLRYQAQPNVSLPAAAVALGDSLVLRTAQQELIRGVRGISGKTLRAGSTLPTEPAIVLGTLDTIPDITRPAGLIEDGYWIKTMPVNGKPSIVITAKNDRGVLYGTFAFLRKLAFSENVTSMDEVQNPYARIRWTNEWDNLDGTIERGYGGRSIFFEKSNVLADLTRAGDYARLLASIGINGATITNVNANARAITPGFIPQLARIADVFRPWGVRLSIAVDLSSPKLIGGLDTFDPLDPQVVKWWKDKVDEIYKVIPDFGGFVLKADSEGRVGPSTYGRTHADAANVIARALKPHGGFIFYRGFVYDHNMDWRNLKNDRARAAYDNFQQLDGQFEDNALVQIKHGPIDFQVREPASPLFGALEKTNQAIELQITQEYFGQARHMVYLIPMWKEVLDFDMHAKGAGTPVKALVAGKTFHRPVGGFVGVSNVGRDNNWLGHHLSMANLYGFGRLAWNPDLTSKQIADEWARLTFGSDPKVVDTISTMQLISWRAFENYTGPLGAQTLTEITGNHYGPAVESQERNGWGQWHRADEKGIGMNRTVADGTGYIGQYHAPVAKMYESLESCPDELILFMHHVPYTYTLHSGKTVIQHIYDTHYEGAATAQDYVTQWKSLEGRIDEERYKAILAKLEYQAGHAQVWRDAVNSWFLKTSAIPDKTGRAGNYPDRIEAEDMKLRGYNVIDVKPFEAASQFKAVRCTVECSASTEFKGQPGWYTIDVQYFDQNAGAAQYRVLIGSQVVDQWVADNDIPTRNIDAHSSSRRRIPGIALRPGDVIRIEGIADGWDSAGLDYIEIHKP